MILDEMLFSRQFDARFQLDFLHIRIHMKLKKKKKKKEQEQKKKKKKKNRFVHFVPNRVSGFR